MIRFVTINRNGKRSNVSPTCKGAKDLAQWVWENSATILNSTNDSHKFIVENTITAEFDEPFGRRSLHSAEEIKELESRIHECENIW